MRRIRIYKKKKRKINIERLHLEELRETRVKGNPFFQFIQYCRKQFQNETVFTVGFYLFFYTW